MKERIKQICIDSNATVLAALKQMDVTRRKLLIVTEGEKYRSVLSIGDIQRAIIRGESMDEPIVKILRPATKVAKASQDRPS